MDELNLDNILGADDIDNLFLQEENPSDNESQKEQTKESNNKGQEDNTADVDLNSLFDSQQESVSSEENIEEQENTSSNKDSKSPNNFYSSIAKALKEDSVFPDLDDNAINSVVEPEDFKRLIEDQIQTRLDERQQRIEAALNAGAAPDEITQFENTLNTLNSIEEDTILDEGEKGVDIRRRLIAQDLLNRGYSRDKVERELKKSFDSGTDIDDAREALESNKQYFQSKYNSLINDSKAKLLKDKQDRETQAKNLRKSILEDDKFFGDLAVDKNTRQKIYDNISKPIYKDADSGNYFTAIQKYAKENPTDFQKNLGLIYTLTDGFTKLDNLLQGKIKKEVSKGIRELEHTINSTSRTSGGSLNFASGSDDSNSYFNGLSLDL